MKYVDLIERLLKRAEIRRQISTRKSVQEGKPDKLADLLEEAAEALNQMKCSASPEELKMFCLVTSSAILTRLTGMLAELEKEGCVS